MSARSWFEYHVEACLVGGGEDSKARVFAALMRRCKEPLEAELKPSAIDVVCRDGVVEWRVRILVKKEGGYVSGGMKLYAKAPEADLAAKTGLSIYKLVLETGGWTLGECNLNDIAMKLLFDELGFDEQSDMNGL